MRKELTSLDLKFLSTELKALIGGIIQKAWQEGKEVRLEIFLSGKGTFELFFEPGKIFITEYRRKAPEVPEAFAMALRKHLKGQKILNVSQPRFERIIEMETENNILIFELFSKGNVILCDKKYNIIVPLEVQVWRDRKIIPRMKYQYPPSVADPYELKIEQFYNLLRSTEKDVVRFLAVDLSFSGLYAEEICARACVDKHKLCKQLSKEEIQKLFKSFHGLLSKPSPRIIFEDSKTIDVVPIEMEIYKDKRSHLFHNFTTALDEYFTHKEVAAAVVEKKAELQAEEEKLNRILKEQEAALKKWRKVERENRKKAEAIYKNFELVEKIISTLNEARKQGIGWEEIKKRIKKEKTKETRAIKEIREKEGVVVLKLK